MKFHSDNWAGAHPAISENLLRHSAGMSAAYGQSTLDKQVEATFNEIFEREVAVYFVGTGTAANSLGLAAINRPGGVCFCHTEAHLVKDECGAPEYFTGGARLQTVSGKEGKMLPRRLERELSHFRPDFIHAGQPMAVTITQSTEVGTLYKAEEIEALAAICQRKGLPLHMDGARFTNAVAAQGITPAEMTWKRGVDLLSFGGTKNGCWCAEALVFFNPEQAKELPFIRKRSAQLFSKTRFIAAQFEAYFQDDLWLNLARHANTQAAKLADIISAQDDFRLAYPCEANELFVTMKKEHARQLDDLGLGSYPWPVPEDIEDEVADDEILLRLVTNFQTSDDELAEFQAALATR
jgi:threonine aldolase